MTEITEPQPSEAVSAAQVEQWLRQVVAEFANLPAEEIQPHLPLSEYGLSSI
jgi:hypothetical protein